MRRFAFPLSASISIPASPAPLNWTKLEAISASGIHRPADLTFTWTGGDPAGEYVVIAGALMLPGFGPKVPLGVASAFLCTERADAGQFRVPSAVLSALPAGSLDIAYLTYPAFSGTTAAFR